MKMKKTIGIIGFGRFGQLAAKHLKKQFQVFVSDKTNRSKKAKRLGVTFSSLEDCAAKDIVLLCVPISSFEKVLKQITPFLKPGSLVLDVCSVKEEPVKAMKKLVPKHCECIGTHPLFGPDTAANSLKGKKIILCPIRTKRLTEIKKFLKGLGLNVIVVDPKEHDKQMAESLALIHLLGKALLNMGVRRTDLATPTHERLMELVDIVENNSEQLFVDMQTHNRFAKKARKCLITKLSKIDSSLKKA